MGAFVGYGLWAAWTSDLQSHITVADVQDLVASQQGFDEVNFLTVGGTTKGSCRVMQFITHFIWGHVYETSTTV